MSGVEVNTQSCMLRPRMDASSSVIANLLIILLLSRPLPI